MQNDLLLFAERAGAGDPDALARLYDRTSRLVYSLALRILRREDEAEEVVLDVYAQVWRTAARFDVRRGSIEAWLLNMARSRAVDRLRSRAARPDLDSLGCAVVDIEDLGDQATADELVDAFDARRRADLMLLTLAPEDRRMIELAFYEGFTHSELSVLLGLPLGTVKTRIRRCLMRMRNAVDGRLAAIQST